MPQISVIMPARDAAWCIGETMEAFRRQSFADFELIICDDGSSDGTRAIVEAAGLSDGRIRPATSPRRGAAAARNHGLDLAVGEIVIFFDSDDRPDDNFLEVFASAFRNRAVDCAISDFRSESQDGGLLSGHRNSLAGRARPADMCAEIMTGGLRLAQTVLAYRRAALASVSARYLEGVRCFEDLPFWCEAILAAREIVWLEGSYAAYVIHEKQTTRDTSAREEQFRCEREALESLKGRVERLTALGHTGAEEGAFLTRFVDEVMYPHLLVKQMSFCLKNGAADKYHALRSSFEFQKYILGSPKGLLFKYFKDTWAKSLVLSGCPCLFERHYRRRGQKNSRRHKKRREME